MLSAKHTLILVVVALAVTGCGSSDEVSPDATASGGRAGYGQAPGGGGPGGGGPGGGGPGGSGKVAAVSGTTAQVQSSSGQVAVSWTAKTAFTEEVATRASALKAGDCVVAVPAPTPEADSNPSSSDEVVAATVRIVAPVAGSCSSGLPGGRAGTPGDRPSGAPTEMPSAAPDGAGPGGRAGGFGAFGKVTAVSGSGFTVESTRPGSSEATSVAVTTSATTTWSTTRKASAASVAVGRCVTSVGPADEIGAIAAVSITVSAPVEGECATGPGGGRPPAGVDGPGENQGPTP